MLGEWGMAYSAIPTLIQEIQNGKGKDGSGKKMEIKKQFSTVDIYQALTPCQTTSPQRPKSHDDLWFTESRTLTTQETLSQKFFNNKKKHLEIWNTCSDFSVFVCGFLILVWSGLLLRMWQGFSWPLNWLARLSGMTLSFWPSCSHLPWAGIPGVHDHVPVALGFNPSHGLGKYSSSWGMPPLPPYSCSEDMWCHKMNQRKAISCHQNRIRDDVKEAVGRWVLSTVLRQTRTVQLSFGR